MQERINYVDKLYENNDILSLHEELKIVDRVILDYETQLLELLEKNDIKDIKNTRNNLFDKLNSEREFRNYIEKLLSWN